MILCCDTSTDFAVFALAGESGELLAEVTLRHGRELSRRFFGALDSLFLAGGSSLEHIDAFAVGVGPGSFTGVRVAVATLKTLAQVAGKPLVGIGTLDIYAGLLAGSLPEDAWIVAVLPSRRGEVYASIYNAQGQAQQGPSVATHEQLSRLIGELQESHPLALCGAVSGLPQPPACSLVLDVPSPPAGSFARLAAAAVKRGAPAEPASIVPVYAAPPAISQHKTL